MKTIPVGTGKNDQPSEDTTRPIRVVRESGAMSIEPCRYRLNGLAIWNYALPPEEPRPADWGTDDRFSITHESSGLCISIHPTLHEAKLCAQILGMLNVDWHQDMATIKAMVKEDRTAHITIFCVKNRRIHETDALGAVMKGARA